MHKSFSTALLALAVISTAKLALAQNNIVFVTSTTYLGNLGGATAYDTQCNTRATAAGLSNPGNNQFVAWMSDANSTVVARLGGLSARGYVRVDGVPVADRIVQDLFPSGLGEGNEILNPIDRDEFGVQVSATALVWTGTLSNGIVSNSTCNNWTGGSFVAGMEGRVTGGPFVWTQGTADLCNQSRRLYCFQKTFTNPLSMTPDQGPIAFVTTNTFTPSLATGLTGADALCANEATQAGLTGSWKALLATSTASAASRFAGYSGNYRRPDGIVIGAGAAIMSGSALNSGIWQAANGTYLPSAIESNAVFTGAPTPNVVGATGTTCTDWTSTSGSATAGRENYSSALWWNGGIPQSCNTPTRIYCVQEVSANQRRGILVSE